jgi:hypothetical protein
MGKTIRVEVTAGDIAAGVPASCSSCPIALAAARAGLDRPDYYAERFIFFGEPGERLKVEVPEAARLFAVRFDQRAPVQPFSFELGEATPVRTGDMP